MWTDPGSRRPTRIHWISRFRVLRAVSRTAGAGWCDERGARRARDGGWFHPGLAGCDAQRHMSERPGPPDQPHPHAALGPEPIRTIDRDELKAKLDRGDDVKLIMALNRWAFAAKHIPGSLHFDTPEALYAAVRPEDEVVVYCSQVDCLSSVALYRDLLRRGYRNVRRYAGGLLDWEDAGLPLEGEFASSR
jgi:rhodanese-related sulfurtransferase